MWICLLGISALPPVLYSSKVCPKASIPWQMRTVNGSFSMLSTVEDAYDVLRVSSYSRRGALNTPQAKPTQSHQRQHGLQHTLARYRPRCSARVVRAQTSAKSPRSPLANPRSRSNAQRDPLAAWSSARPRTTPPCDWASCEVVRPARLKESRV